MRLSKRRRATIAEMNMTPMIDIVFLLLIFFMTVSQVSEVNKVQLSLPKLEGSDDQRPATVTLNVNADGEMIVGGYRMSLGEVLAVVSTQLQKVGDDPGKLQVVIRADERSESKPVNEVVSALGRMQITKVRIAVQTDA